ncbi:MAG: MMPL family transporter [Deltaproteobacteria bacterium]|nr:MMPL family transporter [Deltaproteobacteria bacterium]
MKRPAIDLRRWLVVLAVLAGVPLAVLAGLSRLRIQSDLVSSLPESRALHSARRVLACHPALDRVAIDLSRADGQPDPDGLRKAGRRVEQRLLESGLFNQVGLAAVSRAVLGLAETLPEHLPALFDAEELERAVEPRLDGRSVRVRLQAALESLQQLDGVGRSELLARDPLGLSELVLARLAAQRPAGGARVEGGQLLSGDGRHLLVVARPRGSGSDTALGRRIADVLEGLRAELDASPGSQPGAGTRLAAAGAWRAALDNEAYARADAQRSLWIACLGIALLMLLCLPRAWMGLVALLPAVAGAALALLVYSLIWEHISALALGFGGALVSITVDHGIAWLLFLDQPEAGQGRRASREAWSVGLFAALTTIGAFAALALSGFELLFQVGMFAALGVALSVCFVHLVMPVLLPRLGPARRTSPLPVGRGLGRLGRLAWPAGPALAGVFMVCMAIVGRPGFDVDLGRLSTLTPETAAAEETLARVWGDVFSRRIHLALEAESVPALRSRADSLLGFFRAERARGALRPRPSLAEILPGPVQAASRQKAWRAFFDLERRQVLAEQLRAIGEELGFAPDAFQPFIQTLEPDETRELPWTADLLGLLDVHRVPGGAVWLGSFEPGERYDAESFAQRAEEAGLSVFDPTHFSKALGELLGQTFGRMLWVIGGAVGLLLVLLFMDAWLVGLVLVPLAFAWLGTLGVLSLLGRPLDVPSAMLAVVVLGMGVDYALLLIRGRQRYPSPDHPALEPVRLAVMLAGGSTLLGMLSLLAADHVVARSAGVMSSLGIGLSLLGALLVLPPLLDRLFATEPFPAGAFRAGSRELRRALRRRYRRLPAGVRFFAAFKLRLDPMFPRLLDWAGESGQVLDLGCGLGVPAVFLLLCRPALRYTGIEPEPGRARIAARAVGERGQVLCASADALASLEGEHDLILVLDVVHFLDDRALQASLAAVAGKLTAGGRLVVRATVPGQGLRWERALETLRFRLRGSRPRFRSADTLAAMIRDAGLAMELVEPGPANRSETWLVARKEQAP